jgi:YD repeat-containing protein
MANQRIDQLTAESTPAAADVLPVFSIAGSDTKKITVKNLVQQGAALVDDASIPVAKVNLSGINGSNLTAGTVTAAKLDTSTIPATGGVTVSSSNLQLVAPTSPIVRNAGTGSLEHATSGVTAGTYTKLTVDTRGHITVGAAIAAADLPIAVSGTVGVMSPGTGLSVTGGGVLNHTSSITAGTTSGFTYDAQGHITGTVALAGADLPIATSSVRGAVRPGTGLSVDGNGILAVTAATNAALGGVIAGSDFAVSTGTISLAAQAGIAAGQYTKVTINSKGIATAGTVLSAGDIPNLAASQITSGSLDIARIAANTITGAKVANYAVTKIGDTQPTAEHIGQFFFNPLSRDLFLWDGNVFQPIGISVGEIVFAGTFDASAGGGTGHVASVTAEGTAIGLVEGSPLPAAATANNRYYLVVSESGTITSGNAPNVALAPPDIVLSTGIEWTEVDVSQTFTSVSASQVAFTPEGTIAANNVQAAIEEVNNEKLGLAGGTVTGNLEIGTAGSLSFEGSTANAFETTIAVVDPTADRTITLPNETGTVIVSGNASIVNADINASAGIAYSKLATLTSGNILVGNGSNVATSVAMSGDVTITNAGVAAIASNVIVDGDISASAEIAVSKLADGTARQLLQTDAAGTGVEWTDNVDVPGTLDVTGAATFDGTVYVGGALTLEGTTADAFELTFACEPTADRTVTLPDATTTLAGLGVVQSFTVAQRGAITALTDGATITADFAAANNFSVTLGGSRTLANPSNQTAGQSGCIWITQDATGSRTLAYGSQWDFTGGTAPTLSTAAASVDCLVYAVQSNTKITATLISNLS